MSQYEGMHRALLGGLLVIRAVTVRSLVAERETPSMVNIAA